MIEWISPEVTAPPFGERLLMIILFGGMRPHTHATIGAVIEGTPKKWFEKEDKPPYIMTLEVAPFDKVDVKNLIAWAPINGLPK